MKKYILGIDPGINGALCLYDPHNRQIWALCSLPSYELPNGKRVLEPRKLSTYLKQFQPEIKFAVIEDVSAMPGQGVVSMFRFGEALGLIKGVLAAHEINVVPVTPAVWKAQMHLTNEKIDSLRMARDLFPMDTDCFETTKDADKAESALLAVWGSLYLGNVTPLPK